ncbi:MAG: bifunctional riboflavin kinase/FAD synthetase [Candidatus Dormibacteria bacterium]
MTAVSAQSMRSAFGLSPEPGPVTLTLGTFDGVHLGHREVIRRTVEHARAAGNRAEVITYDPHPRCVVDPDRCPQLLTTVDERADLLAELGVDRMTVLQFDQALARTSATEFMDRVVGALELKHMVVGHDHRLGHDRAGDHRFLQDYAASHGFTVEQVPAVTLATEAVSSSAVRRLLMEGLVSDASRLLGHDYFINSYVEHGAGRGSRIGYPTANIAVTPNKFIPGRGVYAVRVSVGGEEHQGVLNIGYRPTFGGDKLTVEAFIFDFDQDVYRDKLRVAFVERIREERRFENVDALVQQIDRDVESARAILNP